MLPNWWGGPPGPRGSPWTRCSLDQRLVSLRRADEGVGCGPGGPPHRMQVTPRRLI